MQGSNHEQGLSLILRKPRRSRISGDELPPWRPAGIDICKEQQIVSPRGDIGPPRRIVKPAQASENVKPMGRKAVSKHVAVQLDSNKGRRILGAVDNIIQHSLVHPNNDMQKQKMKPAVIKHGMNKVRRIGGGRLAPKWDIPIPMYDASSASQARLYIVPAAARQHHSQEQLQLSSLLGEAIATPRGKQGSINISVALPQSEGVSSLMAGGPLELAALFEQGPGWMRSSSMDAGKVQVASRSASKGGASASRTSKHDLRYVNAFCIR